jgi:hypothetical protein
MRILQSDLSSGHGEMLRVKLEDGDKIPSPGAVLDVFGTKYKVVGAETSRLGDELSPYVGLLIEKVIAEIPFTRQDVKAYLDGAITSWRKTLQTAKDADLGEEILVARCYIDAFQSMHTSFFGETLP